MDSKHRHELQQNDLADFLANFRTWWEKHGNKVLTVVLIVLAFFVIKRFLDARKMAAHETSWTDLANASSPDAFTRIAREHAGTPVEALAYLNAGDLLLQEVAIPEAPTATAPATRADSAAKLDEAEANYNKARNVPEASETVKLNALLGLASVAESRGKIDEARDYYNQVIEQAENFAFIRGQAKARLAMLDSLARPVSFGTDRPLPPTDALPPIPLELPQPPATAPATQPG